MPIDIVSAVTIEIIGYRNSECSPFPCDDDRTCGLIACMPSNQLISATEALRTKLKEEFAEDVTVTLTLLDDEVPDYIREIYEEKHPAIPMILINRTLIPLGRIAYTPIRDAVYKVVHG
jgi:hypothetical protein